MVNIIADVWQWPVVAAFDVGLALGFGYVVGWMVWGSPVDAEVVWEAVGGLSDAGVKGVL